MWDISGVGGANYRKRARDDLPAVAKRDDDSLSISRTSAYSSVADDDDTDDDTMSRSDDVVSSSETTESVSDHQSAEDTDDEGESGSDSGDPEMRVIDVRKVEEDDGGDEDVEIARAKLLDAAVSRTRTTLWDVEDPSDVQRRADQIRGAVLALVSGARAAEAVDGGRRGAVFLEKQALRVASQITSLLEPLSEDAAKWRSLAKPAWWWQEQAARETWPVRVIPCVKINRPVANEVVQGGGGAFAAGKAVAEAGIKNNVDSSAPRWQVEELQRWGDALRSGNRETYQATQRKIASLNERTVRGDTVIDADAHVAVFRPSPSPSSTSENDDGLGTFFYGGDADRPPQQQQHAAPPSFRVRRLNGATYRAATWPIEALSHGEEVVAHGVAPPAADVDEEDEDDQDRQMSILMSNESWTQVCGLSLNRSGHSSNDVTAVRRAPNVLPFDFQAYVHHVSESLKTGDEVEVFIDAPVWRVIDGKPLNSGVRGENGEDGSIKARVVALPPPLQGKQNEPSTQHATRRLRLEVLSKGFPHSFKPRLDET